MLGLGYTGSRHRVSTRNSWPRSPRRRLWAQGRCCSWWKVFSGHREAHPTKSTHGFRYHPFLARFRTLWRTYIGTCKFDWELILLRSATLFGWLWSDWISGCCLGYNLNRSMEDNSIRPYLKNIIQDGPVSSALVPWWYVQNWSIIVSATTLISYYYKYLNRIIIQVLSSA